MIRVSRNPDVNWRNDHLQFARLLAEMLTTITFTDLERDELCASMDLTRDQLNELFDRAQAAWDDVKARTV